MRSALTGFWVQRLREAEAGGDLATAAAAEAQAIAFDDGAHREVLAGLAWVANRGRVALQLIPIRRQGDRTEVPGGEAIECAAGAQLQIRCGRYLATTADGVRLAVIIERGCRRDLALPVPPADLAAGEVFEPGGEAFDETGRSLGTVAPFVIQAREVTCGEWLDFVNDPAVSAQIDATLRDHGQLSLVPRDSAYYSPGEDKGLARWRRRSGFIGRGSGWSLDDGKGRIDPGTPVSEISHDDAVAYAAWRSRRDGKAWRLPTVVEWQFAVQGGDRRAYPWGSADDMLLCASYSAQVREAGLIAMPGARFPSDRSVQGVWDLAGSRSEFCAGGSGANPELRPVLGGNLMERQPDRFTAWSRRDVDRRLVSQSWGVRLVFSLRASPPRP